MLLKKDINIDGAVIQLSPMSVREVMKYDRKIVGIVAPIIGQMMGVNPESVEGDELTRVASAIALQLNSLPDSEYMPMMEALLATAILCDTGMAPTQLTPDNWDRALGGRGALFIYKLMIEAVKFNKFLPFALGELLSTIGKETPTISGTTEPKQ